MQLPWVILNLRPWGTLINIIIVRYLTSVCRYVLPPPGSESLSSRFGLPSISKDDPAYSDQDYWHGRIWGPMVQLVYWGLREYDTDTVKGARAGLVAQSRNLFLKNFLGFEFDSNVKGGNYTVGFPGMGRYIFENYGADTGLGYAYSSSATPMYSWGCLLGFIGLQENGFYDPLS